MISSKEIVPSSTIAMAWQEFVNEKKFNQTKVRPEIARSWQRSSMAGVDPYDGISHLVLTPRQLDKLLERRKELINVANPFMVSLYQFVAGSGFIVILADENGFLLEVLGDDNTLQNALELNLIKGANWAEKETGTNGVGTALVIKKPFQVSGAEHYCRKVHAWTCSAAPIWGEDNKIIGALQMSGPSGKTHLHTLGMVVASVEAIQSHLRVNQSNHDLVQLNNRLNDIFLTVSDGVIVLDKQGLINKVNPVAEKIFTAFASNVQGTSIFCYIDKTAVVKEMLDYGRPYNDTELTLTTGKNFLRCLSSGKPIKESNGSVTGGVIFINPIQRINKLINRFSGALAKFCFQDILGKSPDLMAAVELAVQAAANTGTVLLQGESGTGKEVFAQAIHNQSSRKRGPFIAVNCGAIPRDLIGSELFGYEEGAFTGAYRGGRPGKFELASGGTLFLDEIGDMPHEQQVALLRVLQDKCITRLGGEKVIVVDVRIICASNKNLEAEVEKGNFRRDLYYRLNVISIKLPPLRERPEDIPLLLQFFLHKMGKKNGKSIDRVDPEVLDCLYQYDWPGNIREFQNVIERAVNMAKGSRIGLEHLPETVVAPHRPLLSPDEPAVPLFGLNKIKQLTAEKEQREIINLLIKNKGNISKSARELGISRNSLYRKMHKFNLLT